MKHVTFKEVENGNIFYVPKTVGLVPCVKYNNHYGDIMENIHYAYQKGMFKKFCPNRDVLIKK